MSESSCETCKLRATYDNKPKSLIGRFWRWHINWCPGWKKYLGSVTDEKKAELVKLYDLKLK